MIARRRILHATLVFLRSSALFFFLASVVAQARDLPEFAPLVEKQTPVVVNITATQAHASNPLAQSFGNDFQVPDWLKRLAPRGEPAPQTPDDDVATGSGFIIGADGFILTNAHVVQGASEIMVRLTDRRELPATVVGRDKRSDIALLKVDAKGLPVARLGNPSQLKVGDWVLAIGSPFGFESTVTAGIVSAKGRALPDETLVPFIQTDVAINPGNSGGPLFNLKGEVVGINSQIYSQSGGFMGISFSIPIDVAMEVQQQLREFGYVKRGRIGITIQDVTRDVADSFGLPTPSGALVSGVASDGTAYAAGIKVGDIVTRFNGKPVADSIELPRIVGAVRPGTHATIQIFRAGSFRDLPVEVSEFEQDDDDPDPAVAAPSVLRGANRIGLLTEDLSTRQKRELKLKGGASIRQSSGVAARAELRAGDVVTALISRGKTEEIASADHFNRLIAALPAGSPVSLRVQRGDAVSFVGMRVPTDASAAKR